MTTKSLDRLLFIQGHKCFFCNQHLDRKDASVEHLLAVSRLGSNEDDNCVACCKTVNQYLGSLTLKQKIEVILNQHGTFKCPATPGRPAHAPVQAVGSSNPIIKQMTGDVAEQYEMVLAHLKGMGKSKPKTLKTLSNRLRSATIPEPLITILLEHLQQEGVISLQGNHVAYHL